MNSLSMYDFMPIPDNHLQYSKEFIRNSSALVLGHHQNENGEHAGEHATVLIGLSERSLGLKEYLSIYHREFDNLPVSFVHIQSEEIELYSSKQFLKNSDFSSFKTKEKPENTAFPGRQQNPIMNLLNNILLESIRMGAQDLHLEHREEEGLIRIIVANRSIILRRLSHAIFTPLINQIKILSGMNLLEKKLPQDSSFRYEGGSKKVDIRVSAIGTLHGESLSLRILLPLTSARSLEGLGYKTHTVHLLRKIIHEEQGLLLFCGPTGSGKSTSMNSLIQELDPDSKKIISIEDPIEIHNPLIEQIQVQEDRNMGFGQILRRVLRRSPDIILLGEIRDEESAALAIRAALSGHLLISTIHCSRAAEASSRLKSLGVEEAVQRSVIRGIVAQRLVEVAPYQLSVQEEILIPNNNTFHNKEIE